jgi:diketogulonate reductase-like aldo/keto reductase
VGERLFEIESGIIAGYQLRLAENADIFDFNLSEKEMEAIGRLRSAGQRICDYTFSPEWDTP